MAAATGGGAGALAGVRILDFTNLLAGPIGTMFLGLMGAEVIKVESKVQMDGARRPPYAYEDPERSAVFNALNLNKQSIQLNLKHPEALELAYRLVGISDAVVENMRPGVMDRLGLGYERLSQVNPTIVMASISNGGASGPEASYPGYAAVFNGLSGMGHLTGYPDGPPTEIRDSTDARVATNATFVVLVALFHRLRTGEGQLIDLSSREAITVPAAEALMDYVMNQRVPGRLGNRDPVMAPHGCYRCKGEDSWVTIAVGTDAEWEALCRVAGHREWAADSRFSDSFLRHLNQDVLDRLVEDWTRNHPTHELAELLQSAGVAASPSMSSRDLVEDAHLRARGVWQEVHHPVMGTSRVQGPPWRFSETAARVHSPGPLMGQHNQSVFGELLGVSQRELQGWMEDGTVG